MAKKNNGIRDFAAELERQERLAAQELERQRQMDTYRYFLEAANATFSALEPMLGQSIMSDAHIRLEVGIAGGTHPDVIGGFEGYTFVIRTISPELGIFVLTFDMAGPVGFQFSGANMFVKGLVGAIDTFEARNDE